MAAYNSDLDRITEAEIVPDFVERLTLGRDLNVYSLTLNDHLQGSIPGAIPEANGFRKGDHVTKVLATLSFASLPYAVRRALLSGDIYMGQITVKDTNVKSVSFEIGEYKATTMNVIYATTDMFRLDIAPIFTKSVNGNYASFAAEFDTVIPRYTVFNVFVG